MIAFIVLAAALTAGCVLAVAVPLLRRGKSAPAPAAALAAVVVLVVGGAGLYVSWSNWRWQAAPAADSPQTMVARLARQLEADPKNLEGWLMLGRSSVVLQEFPMALRAFERADRLSAGKSVEALLGEAEALALQDPAELTGRAGRLIDRALVLDPDSGKALFFGATVAARRGDVPLARERFAKLLTLNPPASVRPLIEQQIRLLDEQPPGPGGTAATGPATPAAAAGPSSVRVNVTVSPKLTGTSNLRAPLFVFVHRAGEGGPPLAAKRLESQFPQPVTLTPADAMIPGRSFAAGQTVQVVARIARSGNPVAVSGDPYGEVTYRVGEDGLLELVIDHLTP
jgi:cytochrome c-type biogenesis protein CcmH